MSSSRAESLSTIVMMPSAFVELCFLAGYTRMMFLEKKRRRIRPELFDRFRETGGHGTASEPSSEPSFRPT